jgi:uncharacterized protein (TIGR00369 family)
MRKLPEHGSCFVCGSLNSHGMGVVWYAREDGTIFAEVTLNEAQQGPPGLAHGGASAALLDEAMGAAVWQAGYRAVSISLNVQYRQPVPLGLKIQVVGKRMDKLDTQIFTQGEICLPDGTIAVRGKGVYVEADHLFTEFADEAWNSQS